MNKKLATGLAAALVVNALALPTAFASTNPEQWSPYLGESNNYTSGGTRYTTQDMYWRTGSVVEFEALNDTFEQQIIYYDYDNSAWATEGKALQSNLPDNYLDTPWLDDSGVAGDPNEKNIAVGTFDPTDLATSTWYWATVTLNSTSSSSSMYKIYGQEGLSYCPSVSCVDGQTAAVYIPFKSGFTAPETDRDFKYEWENNNSMTSAADGVSLGDWGAGSLSSTSDVDYWDFNVSSARTVNFFVNMPSGVDYDVNVYNDSGTVVATGRKGSGIDETFSKYLSAGHYYFKIYSYSGSGVYKTYQMIAY